MWPSIDHGLLSPSGKVSKRARAAAMERERVKLFGPEGLAAPAGPPQPTERERDLRQADLLDAMAALHPRAYPKEAARLRAKWAENV